MSIEGDAGAQSLNRIAIGHTRDARFIRARHPMARVGEPGRQIAVIGEQQKAFRVVVEAPDAVDVIAYAGKQIQNRASLLWIGSGGDVTDWLIEQDVATAGGGLDASAGHTDLRPPRHSH